MSKHKFQTEVNQLLDLIIHSLYSHKEIFLRELVSNASDALDKLKYLTLTDEQFKKLKFTPRIDIEFSEQHKTLSISDSGIGMNESDLVENLGTIASSGTKSFLKTISADLQKDANLIGQFGVGFYSAFMVADKIEVTSRKAGEEKAYTWISDGKGEYEIKEAQRPQAGTTVLCHLNKEGEEYAYRWQIENIVKKYSNHIPFPIFLHYEEKTTDDKKKEKTEQKVDQINAASAFWKRPKTELKEEDYQEFYKTIAHEADEPLHYIHTHAEGSMQYSTLFYIPKRAPFDMFRMDYKSGVKLYVKRVFITDEDKELIPPYLRFIKGIIDSEDLPLNVSREILQQNKILNNIKNASVKKILNELSEMSVKEPDKFKEFWAEFRNPIKEGLYSDFANRDTLLELVRFKSTKAEGYTSLAEYKTRMQPDQKSIYFITGEKDHVLRHSPLLELYKKKDIEVLLMDDEIDELVVPSIGRYKDTELKAVNRSDAAEDIKTSADKKAEKEVKPVVDKLKEALKDAVKDVKASVRLSDSPCCIVADEADPSVHMQNMMKAMGQKDLPEIKPILEINPNHDIIKKLAAIEDKAVLEDAAYLLLQQAMLVEGAELKDAAGFIGRLNRFFAKAL